MAAPQRCPALRGIVVARYDRRMRWYCLSVDVVQTQLADAIEGTIHDDHHPIFMKHLRATKLLLFFELDTSTRRRRG